MSSKVSQLAAMFEQNAKQQLRPASALHRSKSCFARASRIKSLPDEFSIGRVMEAKSKIEKDQKQRSHSVTRNVLKSPQATISEKIASLRKCFDVEEDEMKV